MLQLPFANQRTLKLKLVAFKSMCWILVKWLASKAPFLNAIEARASLLDAFYINTSNVNLLFITYPFNTKRFFGLCNHAFKCFRIRFAFIKYHFIHKIKAVVNLVMELDGSIFKLNFLIDTL